MELKATWKFPKGTLEVGDQLASKQMEMGQVLSKYLLSETEILKKYSRQLKYLNLPPNSRYIFTLQLQKSIILRRAF
jgi:hypothetical protein